MSISLLKLWPASVILGLTLLAPPRVDAAPAGQQVFPSQTVFWVSLPEAAGFRDKFSRTQLGMLAQDDSLKPFAEHICRQTLDQFGEVRDTLGVSLDDVLAAAGGELALGIAHREGQRAVSVLVVDPAGKRAGADRLIAKVDAALTSRGARRSSQNLAGLVATVYKMPAKPDAKIQREDLVLFEDGGLICFVESVAEAQAVRARIAGQGDSLADLEDFRKTMARCARESTATPDARWFLAPFKYDLARRSREQKKNLADKKDTFTILREQGFDAIRGVGGHVQVAVDGAKDFVHHTAIYAPAKPGTAGKPASQRYELGMRMAETPNQQANFGVEPWAPRSTANYSTFSIDIQNAFENLESVFDAMSGYEGAFRYTLEGFERDEFGPKIKVRDEIIRHLGDRVTRMADYELPVDTDCERFLFVIEAKDPAKLAEPIDKWMDTDGAILQEVRGVKYWEILPEDETEVTVELGGGLIPLDNQAADPAEESLIRRAAVCVHGGYLIVASDVEFLEQAIFGVTPQESLAGSYDFQAAMRQLDAITNQPRCSWSFTRTDETVRPTYELLREGRLPEGKTFFAQLLNKLLTTPEEQEKAIVRRQRLDGSELPSFELARRYFGPSARAVTAEDDGWFITGVVLNKAGQ
ncbi:hypothetical protein Pla123a_46350 [Posidoniimonas polymericola]|uniref:DUF3352 domain-containing protein n=1 Tax=Posidoniimonas polymericola TaxID=2528002 RepID=A0A5C5XU51_9BACT|nr:hypothetical protein [Posidoniimonas polymericola]TWT66747.1 hypothetical protein Pla123a_46350 [Posidoniimonas polymericola]